MLKLRWFVVTVVLVFSLLLSGLILAAVGWSAARVVQIPPSGYASQQAASAALPQTRAGDPVQPLVSQVKAEPGQNTLVPAPPPTAVQPAKNMQLQAPAPPAGAPGRPEPQSAALRGASPAFTPPALPLREAVPAGAFLESGFPTGAAGSAPAKSALSAAAPGKDLEPLAPPMGGSATLAVCLDTERVWGLVTPGATVTITVNDVQMGAALADENGFFWTTLYDSGGQLPGLAAGDSLEVYASGVLIDSLILYDLTAEIDAQDETVAGQVVGTSSALQVVVYAGGEEPRPAAYSQTVTSDALGNFLVDFTGLWNFVIWDGAAVGYLDGSFEVHRLAYTGPGLQVRPDPWSWAFGRAGAGELITVTVVASDGLTIKGTASGEASPLDGFYYFGDLDTTILPGDRVDMESETGINRSLQIDLLILQMDPDGDRLTGQAPAGAVVHGKVYQVLAPAGWQAVDVSGAADGSGAYSLDVSGLANLMPNDNAVVLLEDADGDELNVSAFAPGLVVNQTWSNASGYAPSGMWQAGAGATVTATVYTSATGATSLYEQQTGDAGWFDFGLPELQPGDVITVELQGSAWQEQVQIQPLTAQVDLEADSIRGQVVTPTTRVELFGSTWQAWDNVAPLWPAGGSFATRTTAAITGSFTAPTAGFDLRHAGGFTLRHRTAGDQSEEIYREVDYVRVYPDYNGAVVLFYPPGTAYTLTLQDSGGNFKAEQTGETWAPLGNGGFVNFNQSGQQIAIGDRLVVRSSAGYSETLVIPAIQVRVDAEADLLYGSGPANTLLYAEIGNQGNGFIPTAADGSFAVRADQFQNVYGSGDAGWGDWGRVCYVLPQGDQNCFDYNWPQIIVETTMDGSNRVYGYGGVPGNTIYITVTHPVSGVVATAQTQSGDCDWCGTADYEVIFDPGTLLPGSIVSADWGSDAIMHYADSMTIADVTAQADPDTDLVTGSAPAETLLWVDVWNDWNSNTLSDVSTGPDGSYTADFTSIGWDVLPGDYFTVHAPAGHAHETQYHFWLPAPRLWLEKWNTPGLAVPGGVYLYQLRYHNDGNGPAENVTLVDSLPDGTSYYGNSAGLPVQVSGQVVTLSLGTLASNSWGEVFLAVNVDPGQPLQSSLPPNCANLSTSSPGDFNIDDNFACSGSTNVDDSQGGMWLRKWAEPNDPAPGELFDYIIEYGTNGSRANFPVWLTDTLPAGVTLLDWEDEWGWGRLWQEVSRAGGKLVLVAPAGVPGDMGGRLRLRMRLDPEAVLRLPLVNRAEISTPDDVDPSNNTNEDQYTRPSLPRPDLNVEKRFQGGSLVPGGWIEYSVNVHNRGNVPLTVRLTDTLPAGVTYQEGSAYFWADSDEGELPPVVAAGDQLVWDAGLLEVNRGLNLSFRVDVDQLLPVGTELNNCILGAGAGGQDYTLFNNQSCAQVTINPPGSNLVVEKRVEWNNWHNLRYTIDFYNTGSQTIQDVWVTDTLPISTTWEGWWNMGFDWGRLVSNTQTSRLLRWQFSELFPGDHGSFDYGVSLDTSSVWPQSYTNTVQITLPPGDIHPADNRLEVAAVKGEIQQVELYVDTEMANAWGRSQPGSTVTITTPHGQYSVYADPDNDGNWGFGEIGPIRVGDRVTVTAGAGSLPVIIDVPDPFSAQADALTDQVSGQIGGLDRARIWVDLYDRVSLEALTDASGNYSLSFPDLLRGGRGEIRYETWISDARVTLHRRFYTPDLLLNVNYDHEWINGNYLPGHTIWFTVTAPGGAVRAEAQLTSAPIPWWGGDSGFQTDNSSWFPSQPDMQVGDVVTARTDSGYTARVELGKIEGTINHLNDEITGTVLASWIGSPVELRCHTWGAPGNAPQKVDTLLADGADTYACRWDPVYEWDVQPGQEIGVQYYEPDGDTVFAAFHQPSPHLGVSNSAEGTPGQGGNLTLWISYLNQGDLAAQNVVITGTAGGLTYLADASGFPVVTGTLPGGESYVAWQLGEVPPGNWIGFPAFYRVDAAAGAQVSNRVRIATSTPFDQGDTGEKDHTWSTQVIANDTRLNVGKNAWTGDPVPGGTLVWAVNTCNNGPTGSANLTLTDTLPLSTTLLSWWGQNPGWVLKSQTAQALVVERPSIPSNWCGEVYLRLRVDPAAQLGQGLLNRARVYASNDVTSGDNETTHLVWVTRPRYNLNAGMWWGGGQLVPGGEIRYHMNYQNQGNLPVDGIVMTDTFPVSTTLQHIRRYDRNWNFMYDVTPLRQGIGWAAWEVGSIENGFSGHFEVQLKINPTAQPGIVLTNTVEILHLPYEDSYKDNRSQLVDKVYDFGPNLRISKWHQWQGPDSAQAYYQIDFNNVGSEPANNVWVTDTLPASTTWSTWWNMGYDWNRQISRTLTAHQLRWQFSTIYPGDNGWLQFTANLEQPNARPRWYTNTVEITTLPGDPAPENNLFQNQAIKPEVDYVELYADTSQANIWGGARPNVPITVTTQSGSYQVLADGSGNWNIGSLGSVLAGERVTVTAGAGLLPVIIEVPEPFVVQPDSSLDQISGQIGGYSHSPLQVDLYGYSGREALTDASGNFVLYYEDILPGANGEVRFYRQQNGTNVVLRRRYYSPDLTMAANYAHEWVQGQYEAGHAITVTVTSSDSLSVKATAHMTTRPLDFWGWQSGWQADGSNWQPATPDILPGDWVYAELDTGAAAALHVGTVGGAVDSVADRVSGAISAPWLTDPVPVRCHAWGAPGGAPAHYDSVQPDGLETYTCAWNPLYEWDVQINQDIAVQYTEPDGDSVYNVFQATAPFVGVDKGTSGSPGEGGGLSFTVNYRNQGSDEAGNVWITDTLKGMSYLGDTSGLPVVTGLSLGGDPYVAWNVGTLPANTWRSFELYVQVEAAAGTWITNTVEISTSNPLNQGDPSNRRYVWTAQVVPGNTDLYPSFGFPFGDPAPGAQMTWNVNVCNSGSTGSAPLVLTDTLPAWFSLVDWWGGSGWTEISRSPGQLVVSRPTVGPQNCAGFFLRVAVDPAAPTNQQVRNTVKVSSPIDLNLTNNQVVNDFTISAPHRNLVINKRWVGGSFNPGQQLIYHSDFWTNSNQILTGLRFTETLPVSTTLVYVKLYDAGWNLIEQLTPIQAAPGVYVWTLGDLDPYYSGHYEIALNINPAVPLGTVLTNTLAIEKRVGEERLDDNQAAISFQVYPPGPNLRVTKRHSWNGEGRLHYSIEFTNQGTELLSSVLVTDTLPAQTSWNGNWWFNFHRTVELLDSPPATQVRWRVSELYPSESGSIEFEIDLASPYLRPAQYTNTVEIFTPDGDPNPSDNTFVDEAVKAEIGQVEFYVDTQHSNIWGQAGLDVPITVTAPTGVFYTRSDPGSGGWNIGDVGPVQLGDTIVVAAGAGLQPLTIHTPALFTAQADSSANQVSGQIGGEAEQQVYVDLYGINTLGSFTDDSGSYQAVFNDIEPGTTGEVRLDKMIGYTRVFLHRRFFEPHLAITVDYARDWVGAAYEQGHLYTVTVTTADGLTVKALQRATTNSVPWYVHPSSNGLNTDNAVWTLSKPDIQPGDRVFVSIDTGYSAELQVGTITGLVDAAQNLVTGTVSAPWIGQPVNLRCYPNELRGGPERFDTLQPDGVDRYACQWLSGEWDLTPAQNVWVRYYEPDEDSVTAYFRQPAPYARLDLSAYDQPGEGGNMLYRILYANDGDLAADNVVISATLEGLEYLYDTSGLSTLTGTNSDGKPYVLWQLGNLPPQGWVGFDLFARVLPPAGGTITNTLRLATSSPFNQGSSWDWNRSVVSQVAPLSTDINISKGPMIGDPPPGNDLDWYLSVCNGSGTSSGWATVTDTLPVSTTLLSWWSDPVGALSPWTEVQRTGSQLVLKTASLPAWGCRTVYLRTALDPGLTPGALLNNTALVAAAGDGNLDNNQTTGSVNLASPYRNVRINKTLTSGAYVPGGGLRYRLEVNNDGNLPVSGVRLTDTLPVSTSLASITYNGSTPVTPLIYAPPTVVWVLPALGPHTGGYYDVLLNINPAALPGTRLTNAANLQHLPGETTYNDNWASVSEVLSAPGPNLRLLKSHTWFNNGQSLQYRLEVANLGDQTHYNMVLTDNLPEGVTWNDWWGPNFPRGLNLEYADPANELKWLIPELRPGEVGFVDFQVNLDNPNLLPAWYTNNASLTIPPGDSSPADNQAQDLAIRGELNSLEIWVDAINASASGVTAPGQNVTFDTPAGIFSAQSDPSSGYFSLGLGSLQDGDVLLVTAGAGLLPVTVQLPDPYQAGADSLTNKVFGQIAAATGTRLYIDVYNYGGAEALVGTGGRFEASYPEFPPGASGHVRYQTSFSDVPTNLYRRFWDERPTILVHSDQDWVSSAMAPGRLVTVTVLAADGFTEKAAAVLPTGSIPGWLGGDYGFQTQPADWSPAQPDIQTGDYVFVDTSAGYSADIRLGELSGSIDLDADSITGTLAAAWLGDPVSVRCYPFADLSNGSQRTDTLLPDGLDEYLCDWEAGEFDLQMGVPVGVRYYEPDGDSLLRAFSRTETHLYVNQLPQGTPGEGSHMQFIVSYGNVGTRTATSVVITQTLRGMSYLSDSLGIPHTTGTTPQGWPYVRWELGDLPVSNPGFYLYAAVEAAAGQAITNTLDISTTDAEDVGTPEEKHSVWSAAVVPNGTHVNIPTQWAETSDPLPGELFQWIVHVGVGGSTNSAAIILTDTLPVSTTLVSWQGASAGWNLRLQDSRRLVLERLFGEPGYSYPVILYLRVDPGAPSGLQLANNAQVYSANDLESGDNLSTAYATVGTPTVDLRVTKSWLGGPLVPGGQLFFRVFYWNDGNMSLPTVRITDTLSISFTAATVAWYDNAVGDRGQVTPVLLDDHRVVWELPDLVRGSSGNFDIYLTVDPTAAPDTPITNTAEITPLPDEPNHANNQASWSDRIYAHGPNLRVRKSGYWTGGGEGTRTAYYSVQLENVGDQPASSFWWVDDYPAGMSLDSYELETGRMLSIENDLASTSLRLLVNSLNPGERTSLAMYASVPGSGPLPFGLIFTNTVDADVVAGDPSPADNHAQLVLGTGPDLYVQKTLASGTLDAGTLVTYRLVFGNQPSTSVSYWYTRGSAWLTDTLPAGLEFVQATLESCGWCVQTPSRLDGSQVSWNFGSLGEGYRNTLLVTANVAGPLADGALLSNQAEIASDNPAVDIEAFWQNNQASLGLVGRTPVFQVSKRYVSSLSPGGVVTYTLVVTNTGSLAGSGVVLTDTLPANLVYLGGDGAFDGVDVSWNFSSIPANGGTATGWFKATLPQSGTVTNDRYRVIGSDQGVYTTFGPPVSLQVNGSQATLSITPGWNLFSLPLVPDTEYWADVLVDELNALGGECTGLYRWELGDWESYLVELPFWNFPIEPGRGYFLSCGQSVAWSVAGTPVQTGLGVDLSPGFNLVSFPYPAGYWASTLVDAIGAQGGVCTAVYEWAYGDWMGYLVELPFYDFEILADKGYFIQCETGTHFVP